MMTMAIRFKKPHPVGTPQVREKAWSELSRIPSGSIIFVNSMSDTYHEGVALETIQRVHNTASQHPDKTFLMLTKRIERVASIHNDLTWSDNIWIGTSVENHNYYRRLDYLLDIPAAGRFVSAEPLLGEIHLSPYLATGRLNWVILGAESGDNRRAFDPQWARIVRDECQAYEVPYLFKQGSHRKSGQQRLLDGRTWDETPFAETPEPEIHPVQLDMFGSTS